MKLESFEIVNQIKKDILIMLIFWYLPFILSKKRYLNYRYDEMYLIIWKRKIPNKNYNNYISLKTTNNKEHINKNAGIRM